MSDHGSGEGGGGVGANEHEKPSFRERQAERAELELRRLRDEEREAKQKYEAELTELTQARRRKPKDQDDIDALTASVAALKELYEKAEQARISQEQRVDRLMAPPSQGSSTELTQLFETLLLRQDEHHRELIGIQKQTLELYELGQSQSISKLSANAANTIQLIAGVVNMTVIGSLDGVNVGDVSFSWRGGETANTNRAAACLQHCLQLGNDFGVYNISNQTVYEWQLTYQIDGSDSRFTRKLTGKTDLVIGPQNSCTPHQHAAEAQVIIELKTTKTLPEKLHQAVVELLAHNKSFPNRDPPPLCVYTDMMRFCVLTLDKRQLNAHWMSRTDAFNRIRQHLGLAGLSTYDPYTETHFDGGDGNGDDHNHEDEDEDRDDQEETKPTGQSSSNARGFKETKQTTGIRKRTGVVSFRFADAFLNDLVCHPQLGPGMYLWLDELIER
jgi:hypothetical protein